MTQRLVISHANCSDGFAAAWAVHRKFPENTEYHFTHHEAPPPDVTGKDVLITDFCYSLEKMLDIADKAKSLTVYDHHKTAKPILYELRKQRPDVAVVFDMNRSGAGITWDELLGRAVERLWIINYVEDRDLWKWELPESKTINAYLATLPYQFSAWDTVQDADVVFAVDRGLVALAVIDQYVASKVKTAYRVDFEGFNVPCVNAPGFAGSELLSELRKGAPFAVAWERLADGKYRYSLRSADDGEDVAAIAQKYGGGGHRNAAGFTSDRCLFP